MHSAVTSIEVAEACMWHVHVKKLRSLSWADNELIVTFLITATRFFKSLRQRYVSGRNEPSGVKTVFNHGPWLLYSEIKVLSNWTMYHVPSSTILSVGTRFLTLKTSYRCGSDIWVVARLCCRSQYDAKRIVIASIRVAFWQRYTYHKTRYRYQSDTYRYNRVTMYKDLNSNN